MTTTKDIVPVLQKEISPLIKRAEALEIKTEADMNAAGTMLTQINKMGDNITEEREKVTVPLNAALKAERGRWKPLETTISNAVDIIRKKMSDYQTAQKRIADEAARKVAERVGEGRGKLKPETAVAKIAAIDTPASNIEVEGGSVKFRTDKTLKITDKAALLKWIYTNIPMLLTYKESAVLDLLKEGKQIDGAEIEEIQVPVNNR